MIHSEPQYDLMKIHGTENHSMIRIHTFRWSNIAL